MHWLRLAGLPLAAALLMAGCASTGGSQVESTIFDTHRRVVKLDTSMESTVTKLNETTATLSAQVNASDEAIRRVQSLVEENQAQLNQLRQEFNRFADSYRRNNNMTTSPSSMQPSGAVTIVPGPQSSNTQSDAAAMESMDVASSQMSAPPVAPAAGPTAPIQDAPAAPTPVATSAAPATTLATASAAATGTSAPASGEDAESAYRRAQRAYANEDYGTARKQFDEFLRAYPGTDLAANAQFWKAKCFLNENDYRLAIAEFEALRNQYPNHAKVPFALHNQAVAHSRLGETQQAVQLLQSVINDYPANPAADQAKNDLRQLQGN